VFHLFSPSEALLPNEKVQKITSVGLVLLYTQTGCKMLSVS
jgi:hypothetical protein